jgi:hypothetical protein
MQIALRTAGGAPSLATLDSGIPVSDFEPLTARLSKTLAFPRFRAAVLGFSLSARCCSPRSGCMAYSRSS